MEKRYLFFFLITVFLTSSVLAAQYSYNQKIPIIQDGKEIGYVKPYKMNILGTEYPYFKWQRYGFPVGNTFPFAIVEGTTNPLLFGVSGELLSVKVGKVTNIDIEIIIDQTDIQTEINNLDKTLPQNIEAIQKDTEKKINKTIYEINETLDKLNKDITLRVNKFVNRTYHSSLHVVDTYNPSLLAASNLIKNKEAEMAGEIGDSVISFLLDIFATGVGTTYKVIISQLPKSFRQDVSAFIYNIEYTGDNVIESSLADKGVVTLYIGNPSINKVSAQFNNQLKLKGLPYFEENKIIGKRTYSSNDIGIIAAIPEETYWTNNTLQDRWDNDRIRLYKTLIAGIDNDGLTAAATWYNQQLDLAKDSISLAISLTGNTLKRQEIKTNDLLSTLTNTVKNNPKATVGFVTIAQGWILTGMSSLQQSNFDKVPSLGYVIIVKKEGNSYRILETYSIVGDTKSYFLDEYQEVANQVVDNAENINSNSRGEPLPIKQSIPTISGKAAESLLESSTLTQEENKGNSITNFLKNLWRKIFG